MSDQINMLYDLVKEIDRKQDLQTEQLNSINITLVKQHESIDYHIKRTDLAEENTKMLREEVEELRQDVTKLKEPGIARKYLWDALKGIFVLLGGIYTIDQAIRLFSRFFS